jgi:hypothetical protein
MLKPQAFPRASVLGRPVRHTPPVSYLAYSVRHIRMVKKKHTVARAMTLFVDGNVSYTLVG